MRDRTQFGGCSLSRYDLLIVLGLFTCSSLLYAVLGVRFEASTVLSMQFIDPALLTERMGESLWYYHATPPALNLLVGIGLKLFGADAPYFYAVVFHLLGLLTALSVYALTRALSDSKRVAAVTTAALVFSPSFVLYENHLLYDFPAMALLAVATLALYQFVSTKRVGWGIGFFCVLATLLLTRSVFHLIWMAATVAFLLALLGSWRRQILLAAAVPFLVVTLWYAKNYYYFGKFGSSTWMGLGLSNITLSLVPPAQLAPLVERGELSPWALVSRYDSSWPIFRGNLRPPAGVPVLDNMLTAPGHANWNYRDIPAIDRLYTADALTVIRRFPATYVYGVSLANKAYFAPTSISPYFSQANRIAVTPIRLAAPSLLSGASGSMLVVSLQRLGFRFPEDIVVPLRADLLMIVAWVGVFAWAYAVARRALTDSVARSSPRVVVMGFLVMTAAYTYLVSTTLELGENYRYRFLLEPLFFVLAATAATSAFGALRRAKAVRSFFSKLQDHSKRGMTY